MKSAYNEKELHDLDVVKEANRWRREQWISHAQWISISVAYKTVFYHPNFIIRILLFIATLFALSSVTGLFFLMFSEIGEVGLSIASVAYGVGSFYFMKKVFIEGNHHYKSGVTEALLYHACGYVLAGLGGLTHFNPHTHADRQSAGIFVYRHSVPGPYLYSGGLGFTDRLAFL